MHKLYVILSFSLVFLSCRKDEYSEVSNATPYIIEYPGIIEQYLPPMSIPDDNQMTVEGVELGRHLFYETKL